MTIMSSNRDRSLDLSARHLQVLLTSLSSFDGKMMFLTALNVAGISALIGVALTADPVDWLFALSLSLTSLNVAAGLGRLWAPDAVQFPTPEETRRTIEEVGNDETRLEQQHLAAIWYAVRLGHGSLRRLIMLVRVLLLTTGTALTLTVGTAMSAVY